jgi:hypothetical protein
MIQSELNLEYRPGYFGKRKALKIKSLNEAYGEGNWTLVWTGDAGYCDFVDACIRYYEESYLAYLKDRKEDLDFICSFGEVIDNNMSNISSGYFYAKQEASSTHIQDIAIRNVMRTLGLHFRGSAFNILTVRGEDSNGWRFNPGQIPFRNPELITQPSMAPGWAKPGSVEDFWQSNKWVATYK